MASWIVAGLVLIGAVLFALRHRRRRAAAGPTMDDWQRALRAISPRGDRAPDGTSPNGTDPTATRRETIGRGVTARYVRRDGPGGDDTVHISAPAPAVDDSKPD